ncbi:hypothetical protein ACFX15_028035 [Malus domestica]
MVRFKCHLSSETQILTLLYILAEMQEWVLFAAVFAVRNSKNMRFQAIHYRHCLFLRYFFLQLFTGKYAAHDRRELFFIVNIQVNPVFQYFSIILCIVLSWVFCEIYWNGGCLVVF